MTDDGLDAVLAELEKLPIGIPGSAKQLVSQRNGVVVTLRCPEARAL